MATATGRVDRRRTRVRPAATRSLRLEQLFDAGTLELLRPRDDSGVVRRPRPHQRRAGRSRSAPTPTVMGGAMGAAGCRHIVDAIDLAVRERRPGDRAVALRRRAAGRGRRGACTPSAWCSQAMIRASGRVPQISVVLGPAAGGAAYGPALTDVVIMSDRRPGLRHRPRRGPLGHRRERRHGIASAAPTPHGRRSGVVHVVTDDEARRARAGAVGHASLLGRPGRVRPGPGRPGQRLSARCCPRTRKRAYDVHPLIAGVLDERRLRRAARQVGAEHRHRRSAGWPAARSA